MQVHPALQQRGWSRRSRETRVTMPLFRFIDRPTIPILLFGSRPACAGEMDMEDRYVVWRACFRKKR